MTTPEWRQHDEHPKRGDDIKLTAFGASVEASGRTVVVVIVALAIVAMGAFGFWLAAEGLAKHEDRTLNDHQAVVKSITTNTRTLETTICVLTLDERERKEYRISGRYCGHGYFEHPRGRSNDDVR